MSIMSCVINGANFARNVDGQDNTPQERNEEEGQEGRRSSNSA